MAKTFPRPTPVQDLPRGIYSTLRVKNDILVYLRDTSRPMPPIGALVDDVDSVPIRKAVVLVPGK